MEALDKAPRYRGRVHPSRRAPRGRRDSGTTLVEIMVAIVILAVLVIGATAFLHTGRSSVRTAECRRTAAQVANERKELAHGLGYAAVSAGDGIVTVDSVQYRWLTTVTPVLADPDDPGSTYKRVDIRVTWEGANADWVYVTTAVSP